MATITSANSVVVLNVPDVFATPIQLQGYAADDAFAVESVEPTEALMGVDGILSAGYTPFITKFTIVLQADSPSIAIMDAWLAAMKAAQEVFFGSLSVVLSSVGKAYTLDKGTLTGAKQLPDGKKVLQPVQYVISFESLIAANI